MKLKTMFALFFIAFLSGCSHVVPFIDGFQGYEGPPRGTSETATVYILNYGPKGYAGLHGFIRSVDDTAILDFDTPAPLEVYVLPGSHRFQLVAGDGAGRRADGAITVDTQAGHTYEIKAELSGNDSVRWRAEDKGKGYIRTDEPYKRAQEEKAKRKQ